MSSDVQREGDLKAFVKKLELLKMSNIDFLFFMKCYHFAVLVLP